MDKTTTDLTIGSRLKYRLMMKESTTNNPTRTDILRAKSSSGMLQQRDYGKLQATLRPLFLFPRIKICLSAPPWARSCVTALLAPHRPARINDRPPRTTHVGSTKKMIPHCFIEDEGIVGIRPERNCDSRCVTTTPRPPVKSEAEDMWNPFPDIIISDYMRRIIPPFVFEIVRQGPGPAFDHILIVFRFALAKLPNEIRRIHLPVGLDRFFHL